jgi:hypothetical protein
VKYLMLICGEYGDEEMPGDDELAAVGRWCQEMDARGIRLAGAGLRPAREATSVRVRDGEVLATDGPFAETKEEIGGFDLLDCANLDDAIEVASRHPAARDSRLELRALWVD